MVHVGQDTAEHEDRVGESLVSAVALRPDDGPERTGIVG